MSDVSGPENYRQAQDEHEMDGGFRHAGMTRNEFWLLCGLVVVGAGTAIWRQRVAGDDLRQEIGRLQADRRTLEEVQSENVRLRALQVSPEKLTALRADREAVGQLRREIEALERSAALTPALAAPPKPGTAPIVPSAQWKNAGRATPAAALETALWAAAGGDIDTLAGMIELLPAEQALASEFFAALPDTVRAEHRTPERLIAMMTAKDIPLGSMQVLDFDDYGTNHMANILVALRNPQGNTKTTQLSLRRAADGWKLQIPREALQQYARAINPALAAEQAKRK